MYRWLKQYTSCRPCAPRRKLETTIRIMEKKNLKPLVFYKV